jgi:hypothetical protein
MSCTLLMYTAILHPLSQRVTPIVRDLVQAHEIDTSISPSFRDRCDNVRRRTFQRGASIATPIFYRSQLFPPLSPESPTFLVDVFTSDDDLARDEWNVHFTMYNLTHRFDVDSQWQHRFRKLLHVHDNAASESTLAKPFAQEAGSMLIKVSFTFGLGSRVVSRQNARKLTRQISLFSSIVVCLSCGLQYRLYITGKV